MDNGVKHSSAGKTAAPRALAKDALGATVLVETAVSEHVLIAFGAAGERRAPQVNVFDEALSVEHAEEAETRALVRRAEELASEGARVAILAGVTALASSRTELVAIATKRLAVVAHAFVDARKGAAESVAALAEIGWGLLFADGAVDAIDLALVARRAAEDSGTPFVVVHDDALTAHVEPVVAPSRELCDVFVGAARTRTKKTSDAAHPVHTDIGDRAFAERVPFALGSAMREIESLAGRPHDVLERVPQADAALVLVAAGHLGESLVAEVARLRAAGHDVGAVKVVALRPFPGPRLVKMLSRALAVCVIEDADAPLAQSNALTREVKAAFADALTWAPEYPGVGRIPRVFSGVVRGELGASDVDAIVHNMLADERGRRTFVLGDGDLPRGGAPADPNAEASAGDLRGLTLRGRARDAATARACASLAVEVLASVLGLRARASVRPLVPAEGGGFAFDILAGRDRPRGAHAPHTVRVVVVDEASALIHANPFVRLAKGGIVAVPTDKRAADALWSEVPAYVKAIAFDRNAKVVGWKAPAAAAPWSMASAVAGLLLALAERSPRAVDGSLVAREVTEGLRHALGHGAQALDGETADAFGKIAREAFESYLEVPRATVERDEESIRFGRKDARASSRPRA